MPILIALAALALAALLAATFAYWKGLDAVVEFAISPSGFVIAAAIAIAIVWAALARHKRAS